MTYDYSSADWDSLRDHFRDVQRMDMLLILPMKFVCGFRLSIPRHK